uniref:Uncharacterized protein n=1 Tax=Arundo donax TaxID=35708 RepID=A0A0A9GPR3_ARUDO
MVVYRYVNPSCETESSYAAISSHTYRQRRRVLAAGG